MSPNFSMALHCSKSKIHCHRHGPRPCMTCPSPPSPPLLLPLPLHSLCSCLMGLLLVPPIHQDRVLCPDLFTDYTFCQGLYSPNVLRLASHLSGHFSIRPSLLIPSHCHPPIILVLFVCFIASALIRYCVCVHLAWSLLYLQCLEIGLDTQ